MTENELQELIRKYHVPKHVMAHMKKVAAVSLFLGEKLHRAGEKINQTLLRQAALLHDILKLCDFPQLDLTYFDQDVTAEEIQFWSQLIKSCHAKGHVQAAYEVLMELGEPVLAHMVKKHRFGSLINVKEKPLTWEEKILYYADKRVLHDRIVSIAERLKDGKKRYFPDGNIPENDGPVEKALYELEKELLTPAGLKPEEITEEAVSHVFYP